MSVTMCRGCGQLLPADARFCENCGVRRDDPPATHSAEQTDPGPLGAAVMAPEAPAAATAPIQASEPSAPVTSEPTAPLGTYEPAATPQRRGRLGYLALMVATGLVLGLIARATCSAMGDSGDEDPGELVAQMPIDPSGGEATFDGGAGKIRVPPGAVSKRETIKIYKRVITERVRAVPPSGGQALVFPPGTLVTYIFGPVNIRLNLPITIIITLPNGQRGLVFVTAQGQVRFLPGVGTGRNVTIVLRSFNLLAPGAITVQG